MTDFYKFKIFQYLVSPPLLQNFCTISGINNCLDAVQFLTWFIVNIFADHHLDLPGFNSTYKARNRQIGANDHLDIQQFCSLKTITDITVT